MATTIALQENSQIGARRPLPEGLAKRTPAEGHGIFEFGLIESGARLNKRSPWTTVLALLLQLMIAGLLCLVPLLCPEKLQKPQVTRLTYLAPAPLAAAPPAATPMRSITPAKVLKTPEPTAKLRAPSENARQNSTPKPEEVPPPISGIVEGVAGGVPGGVVGGLPGGTIGGVLGGAGAAPALAKAVVPPALPRKVRVASGVAEGNLIHDVKPQYPPEARQARLQGTVVLFAVIGKDGSVRDLQVKSGAPVLAQAAIEAVRQWRYKPYLLNGEPVEVDTQITINFTMVAG